MGQLPPRSDSYTRDPHPRNTHYLTENGHGVAVVEVAEVGMVGLARFDSKVVVPNFVEQERRT